MFDADNEEIIRNPSCPQFLKKMNVSIQETIGLFPCQMKTASSEPSEMFLSPTLTLSLDLRKKHLSRDTNTTVILGHASNKQK